MRAVKVAEAVIRYKTFDSRWQYLFGLAEQERINLDPDEAFINHVEAYFHYQQIRWSQRNREAEWGDIEDLLSSLDTTLIEQ